MGISSEILDWNSSTYALNRKLEFNSLASEFTSSSSSFGRKTDPERFTFKVLFTNPSARAGYDTRSIFKRSLTGLNSEFSFS